MNLRYWQQVGYRLMQMDRLELQYRARQEYAKRRDTALAFLGFDFTRNFRNHARSQTGNFFFRPDSVDSILALLRRRLPDQVTRIVQQAEKICRHRLDLLGYEDLDYG